MFGVKILKVIFSYYKLITIPFKVPPPPPGGQYTLLNDAALFKIFLELIFRMFFNILTTIRIIITTLNFWENPKDTRCPIW